MNEKHCDTVEQPTWLGWVSRLFSLAALVGLLAVLVVQACKPERPITFEASLDNSKTRQTGSGWLVAVEVSNSGTRTARNIELDVLLDARVHTLEIETLGSREEVRYALSSAREEPQLRLIVKRFELP